jgi:hypothetical protein
MAKRGARMADIVTEASRRGSNMSIINDSARYRYRYRYRNPLPVPGTGNGSR